MDQLGLGGRLTAPPFEITPQLRRLLDDGAASMTAAFARQRQRNKMSLKQTLINANTTRNVGRWDRLVRAALPFVVGGLWFAGFLPALAAVPLLIIAVMLFPTSITGACSIYYATGISTLPD